MRLLGFISIHERDGYKACLPAFRPHNNTTKKVWSPTFIKCSSNPFQSLPFPYTLPGFALTKESPFEFRLNHGVDNQKAEKGFIRSFTSTNLQQKRLFILHTFVGPSPLVSSLTNNADGTNRRKSSQESVMTPSTVISASPTNLPKVPASVARKPEFHVPLVLFFLRERNERVGGRKTVLLRWVD